MPSESNDEAHHAPNGPRRGRRAKEPRGIGPQTPRAGEPTASPEFAAAYAEFLGGVKERVRRARVGAALAANAELIRLYWQLGRDIVEQEKARGWGAKFVARLASDLRREFPAMKGFSPRNLRYAKAFFAAWPDEAILQQVAAKLPWGHHMLLLDKLDTTPSRLFYARTAIAHGWSRSVLTLQIERQLLARQGSAITNFDRTLPEPHSDLARESLRDPYVFDFLELADDARERDIEQQLLVHVRDFLLELGVGFAFVGSQMRLEVGQQDFYLDMLFYHYRLRCFVVVELKNTAFKPDYAGQLNFYLSAVDDLLKQAEDKPTIGLLLCKSHDRVVVEYALRNMANPIGVAEWQAQMVAALPNDLASSLPSVEQISDILEEIAQEASE